MRNRLQEAIRESGLSQGAVARRAGINPGYLSKLLKGKHVPSAEMLLRLAAALEIPPSGLLGEVEESLSLKKLPVHEEVVVGHPLETDQKPVGEGEVSSEQYRPSRYLLRARGNAMLPTVCDGVGIQAVKAVACPPLARRRNQATSIPAGLAAYSPESAATHKLVGRKNARRQLERDSLSCAGWFPQLPVDSLKRHA